MSNEANEKLLRLALETASDTRLVDIGAGAISNVPKVFGESFGERRGVLVADEITYDVAGRRVTEILSAAGYKAAAPILFPGKPTLYAEYERVLELAEILKSTDAIPIAVGSGTVNDLTKLASYHIGRPYMVVATAASMDGYTSFGAAITRDGFKQTFACPAPRAIVADLDVVAGAPWEMTASGYGDLLGKITAGADWLIADSLGIEPLRARPWSMVQDHLRTWTARPDLLRAWDRESLEHLFVGLVMSGLAMQHAQSSRPASGSEHQFSHLWEMQGLANLVKTVSHGFKVGLGTIASAALYERLFDLPLDELDIEAGTRAWPTKPELEDSVRLTQGNPLFSEKAMEESLAKYITADQLAIRLKTLREVWPALSEKLRSQLFTACQLRDLLRAAGCPVDASAIGLDHSTFKASYFQARQIRSRYTVLDLAFESGCFEKCVDAMFGPVGFWTQSEAKNS